MASREKAPRLITSERAVLGRDEWAFSRGQRVGAPLTSGDNAYYWPGIQAAAYLSSYFVSGKGSKTTLTESVQDGDLPRLTVFIGRSLTARTACTMRNLRLARRVWVWEAGLAARPTASDRDLLIARCLSAYIPVVVRGP